MTEYIWTRNYIFLHITDKRCDSTKVINSLRNHAKVILRRYCRTDYPSLQGIPSLITIALFTKKRTKWQPWRAHNIQWLPLMADRLNDFTWICRYAFRHMVLTFYHVRIRTEWISTVSFFPFCLWKLLALMKLHGIVVTVEQSNFYCFTEVISSGAQHNID